MIDDDMYSEALKVIDDILRSEVLNVIGDSMCSISHRMKHDSVYCFVSAMDGR